MGITRSVLPRHLHQFAPGCGIISADQDFTDYSEGQNVTESNTSKTFPYP